MDFALSGAFGSAKHTPFQCELVRQFYCLGGTEKIRTAGFGLSLEQTNAAQVAGFNFTPRVIAGMAVAHVMLEEFEGPTGLCVSGKELISCPDNPPFQTYARETTRVMPALGYGMSLAKEVRQRRRRARSDRVPNGMDAQRAGAYRHGSAVPARALAHVLRVRHRTSIGAVHRKVPHAIASVPVRASLESIEMVNCSTGVVSVSLVSVARARFRAGSYDVPH